MYNIGIIGSDSSHAEAFSRLINIPDETTGEYRFPDCRVTGIFGFDYPATCKVAEESKISMIVDDPFKLLGKVDAIMVVLRNGGLHAQYAVPFIKAGIPVWIDKPFTVNEDEAELLIKLAASCKTPIAGGSMCKYTDDIRAIKETVSSERKTGKVLSAVINFPADPESEYGGLNFYGPHLVEMALAVFGTDIKSVSAFRNAGGVAAVAGYEDRYVILNFTPNDTGRYYAVIYGESGTVFKKIDISNAYSRGIEEFIKVAKGGKPLLPPEHLITSVRVMNAVINSYLEKGGDVPKIG